jgi:hypothetical protein
MAEKVLRGYAALAADEYARRATTELGFFGYYPAIIALKDAVAHAQDGVLPAPAELREHVGDEAKRALVLARTFFRFDPVTGRLDTAGDALAPEVGAWLHDAVVARGTKPLASGRRYNAQYASVGGTLQGVVSLPPDGTAAGSHVVVGFVVDRDALAGALQRAMGRTPLLPPSLGGNELGKDAVYVRLVDPFGGEILRSGAPFDPVLSVEKKLGSEYGGILEDFTLRTAIDPAAAPKLVIGGLPRSRLPVLIALMAATAGLTLTAGLQLRRERLLGRRSGCSPKHFFSIACAARASGRATSRSSTGRRGGFRTSSRTSCASRAPNGERFGWRLDRTTSGRSFARSSTNFGLLPPAAAPASLLRFPTTPWRPWTTTRCGRSC